MQAYGAVHEFDFRALLAFELDLRLFALGQ